MTQESKTISGAASPFVTSWTYNSADLPLTMKFSPIPISAMGRWIQ
jgi:hypothetical protein